MHPETPSGVHRRTGAGTHGVRIIEGDLGSQFNEVGRSHGAHDAAAHNGYMGLVDGTKMGRRADNTRHDARR